MRKSQKHCVVLTLVLVPMAGMTLDTCGNMQRAAAAAATALVEAQQHAAMHDAAAAQPARALRPQEHTTVPLQLRSLCLTGGPPFAGEHGCLLRQNHPGACLHPVRTHLNNHYPHCPATSSAGHLLDDQHPCVVCACAAERPPRPVSDMESMLRWLSGALYAPAPSFPQGPPCTPPSCPPPPRGSRQ